MGVKERKARERQERKEMILKAAHQLFQDKGFDSVSIRNIADTIEYSPAAIYLHFKDKNEIFYALQGEAFKFFNFYIADLEMILNPFDRLVMLAQKYLEFSFQHPNYYAIMFIAESPSNNENINDWKEAAKTYALLSVIISDCKKMGRFQHKDVKIISFSIWSYMHGMSSLVLRNRMRIYPEQERHLIREQCFRQFLNFLNSL